MLFFEAGLVDRMRASALECVHGTLRVPPKYELRQHQGFIITGRRFREPKFTDMVSLHSTHYTPFLQPGMVCWLGFFFSLSIACEHIRVKYIHNNSLTSVWVLRHGIYREAESR